MKKDNNNLPYRFLPATDNQHPFITDTCKQITFSEFLKDAVQMHILTGTKITRLDNISCVNDTGILACGPLFEQVNCTYLHIQFKEQQFKNASVILVTSSEQTKQLRFFKGIWDPVQEDIMVWCELIPDMARQEIKYLETINS